MPRKPDFYRWLADRSDILFPEVALPQVLSWNPMDYIREEVRRQGFNLGAEAGRLRVEWMAEAWAWAEVQSHARRRPVFDDVVEVGRLVEREKNREGLRRCGVRVGDRICPPWQDVPHLLSALMPRADVMEPLEFYRELLVIHPFIDGNGRTGKIVLTWLAASWEAPIFPPSDFWGSPIRNP